MGGNRRDYCFCFVFFGIYVFSSKKKWKESDIFGHHHLSFFSLKSGDFAEDARLNLLVAVFRSFSSKKFPSRRIKKKRKKKNRKKLKKLRNIRCFLFLLTYYHLAFDD